MFNKERRRILQSLYDGCVLEKMDCSGFDIFDSGWKIKKNGVSGTGFSEALDVDVEFLRSSLFINIIDGSAYITDAGIKKLGYKPKEVK